MHELDRQRGQRRCAASDRPIGPGEAYFAVAREVDGQLQREEYHADAWPGPPEDCLAWWRACTPNTAGAGARVAPSERLMQLLGEWADQPDRVDARYVLALLMVRRKLLRFDGDEPTGQSPGDTMHLIATASGEHHQVTVADPPRERCQQIQAELKAILTPPPQPSEKRAA